MEHPEYYEMNMASFSSRGYIVWTKLSRVMHAKNPHVDTTMFEDLVPLSWVSEYQGDLSRLTGLWMRESDLRPLKKTSAEKKWLFKHNKLGQYILVEIRSLERMIRRTASDAQARTRSAERLLERARQVDPSRLRLPTGNVFDRRFPEEVEDTLIEQCQVHFEAFWDRPIRALKNIDKTFAGTAKIGQWAEAGMETVSYVLSKITSTFTSPLTPPILAVITAVVLALFIDKIPKLLKSAAEFMFPSMTEWFTDKFAEMKKAITVTEEDEKTWANFFQKRVPSVVLMMLECLWFAVKRLIGPAAIGWKVYTYLLKFTTEVDEMSVTTTQIPGVDVDGHLVDQDEVLDFLGLNEESEDPVQYEARKAFYQTDSSTGVWHFGRVLVALCVGMTGVYAVKTDEKAVAFPQQLARFAQGIIAATAVATSVTEVLKYVYSWLPTMWRIWLFEHLGIPPGQAWAHPLIHEWMTGAIGLDRVVTSDRTVLARCFNTRKEVEELFYAIPILHRELKAMGASQIEHREIMRLEKFVTHAMHVVWALRGDFPVRQRPTVIMLCGDSGIGKSTLVHELARDVMGARDGAADFRENEEPLIYTRDQKDEFWSGYANQKVIVYDDFGSTAESKEATELITLVSVNQFMPPMASLDDPAVGVKGTKVNSELIVLCTNMSPQSKYPSINTSEAIYNRLHIPVRVWMKKSYMNSDGSGVDWEKVRKHSVSTSCPHLMFVPINPHDGRDLRYEAGGLAGEPVRLSYQQLVNWSRHELNSARKDFAYALRNCKGLPSNFNKWMTEKQRDLMMRKVSLRCMLAAGWLELSSLGRRAVNSIFAASSTMIDRLYEVVKQKMGSEPVDYVDKSVYSQVETAIVQSGNLEDLFGENDPKGDFKCKGNDDDILRVNDLILELETKYKLTEKGAGMLSKTSVEMTEARKELEESYKKYAHEIESSEVKHYLTGKFRARSRKPNLCPFNLTTVDDNLLVPLGLKRVRVVKEGELAEQIVFRVSKLADPAVYGPVEREANPELDAMEELVPPTSDALDRHTMMDADFIPNYYAREDIVVKDGINRGILLDQIKSGNLVLENTVYDDTEFCAKFKSDVKAKNPPPPPPALTSCVAKLSEKTKAELEETRPKVLDGPRRPGFRIPTKDNQMCFMMAGGGVNPPKEPPGEELDLEQRMEAVRVAAVESCLNDDVSSSEAGTLSEIDSAEAFEETVGHVRGQLARLAVSDENLPLSPIVEDEGIQPIEDAFDRVQRYLDNHSVPEPLSQTEIEEGRAMLKDFVIPPPILDTCPTDSGETTGDMEEEFQAMSLADVPEIIESVSDMKVDLKSSSWEEISLDSESEPPSSLEEEPDTIMDVNKIPTMVIVPSGKKKKKSRPSKKQRYRMARDRDLKKEKESVQLQGVMDTVGDLMGTLFGKKSVMTLQMENQNNANFARRWTNSRERNNRAPNRPRNRYDVRDYQLDRMEQKFDGGQLVTGPDPVVSARARMYKGISHSNTLEVLIETPLSEIDENAKKDLGTLKERAEVKPGFVQGCKDRWAALKQGVAAFYKKWVTDAPTWCKYLLVTIGIVGVGGALLYKLIKWWTGVEGEDVSLEGILGQQRDQMLKLIALCSKDINQTLNTLPMDELRNITKLRLAECNIVDPDPAVFSEMLGKATAPADAHKCFITQIKDMLDEIPKEARASLVTTEIDEMDSWSLVKLNNLRSTIVNGIKGMSSDIIGDALDIAAVTPRLYGLLRRHFKGVDIDEEPPEVLKTEEGGEIVTMEYAHGERGSASRRKYANKQRGKNPNRMKIPGRYRNNKSFARARKLGNRGKYHGGAVDQSVLQAKYAVPEVKFGIVKNMRTTAALHFIPVRGRTIMLPRHFFKGAQKGDQIKILYDGVEFYDTYNGDNLRALQYRYAPEASEVCVYLFTANIPFFPDQRKLIVGTEDFPDEGMFEEALLMHRDGSLKPTDVYISPYAVRTKGTNISSTVTKEVCTWSGLREPGDCGLPILIYVPFKGYKVCGIHVYKAETDAREVAAALTLPQIECLRRAFPETINTEGLVDENHLVENVVRTELPVEGNFEHIGMSGAHRSMAQETTLVPSPIRGKHGLSGDDHSPAAMKSDDPRLNWREIGSAPRPIEHLALERYGPVLIPYPDEYRVMARKWELSERMRIPFKLPVRELTMHEACNGYGALKRICLQTSPGYGWVKKSAGRGKERLFVTRDDGTIFPIPELEAAVREILDQASLGVYKETVWTDSLKDELRKNGKVALAKTRGFTIAEVSLLIATRMVLGASMAFDNASWRYGSSAVGMNPWSVDWDNMYKYLHAVSTKGLDADWKAYDSTVGAEEWQDEFLVDREWYRLNGCDDVSFQNRLEIMYYAMSHRLTVNGNVVYRLHSGNGSGGPKTTIVNTRSNDRRMKMAWIAHPDLPNSLTEYRKNVRCKFFGDDTLAAVNPAVGDKFNGKYLKKFHGTYNRTITPANKLGKFTDNLVDLTECTFLSQRTIVNYRQGVNFWPAPTEEITDKTLNWCRKNENSSRFVNTADRMSCVFLRYAHLCESDYLRLVSKLTNLAEECCPVVTPMLKVPTWDELQEWFRSAPAWGEEDDHVFGSFGGHATGVEFARMQSNALGDAMIIPSNLGEEVGVVDGSGVITNTGGVVLAGTEAPATAPSAPNPVSEKAIAEAPFTVKGLSERFAFVETVDWEVGHDVGHVLKSYRVPWDLVRVNPIKTPLQKFRFMNSKMTVRLEINGTRFHSGQLILWWVPLMSSGDIAQWQQQMRSSQSILKHVMLQPRSVTPVELEIPFVHPKSYLNISEREDPLEFMGTLVLSVFNELGIEPGVDPNTTMEVPVSVYVKLTDSTFAVPVGENVFTQGVGSSKVSRVVITGDNATVPIEFGSDKVEQSANVTTMDNPSLQMPPFPVSRRGHPPYAYCQGTEFMDKFVLYPSQLEVTDPTHFGTTVDEMDFNALMTKPTFCESFEWSASTVGGKRLMWGYISPTDCLHHPKYALHRDMPMVEFIAKNFYMWKGNLRYVFDIIAAEVHTGKLMFTTHYGRSHPPDELETAACEYSALMSLTPESSTFEVEVPYLGDIPQKFIVNGQDSGLRGSVGVWAIWVVNKLRTPGLATTQITVNMYKAAGANFKLYYLGANGADLTPHVATFQGVPTKIVAGCGGATQAVEYDEDYPSMRDVARRFVPFKEISCAKVNGLLFSCTVDQLVQKICPQWSPIYLGWRGGLRLRITYSEPVSIFATFIPYDKEIQAKAVDKVVEYILGKETTKYMSLPIIGSNPDVGYVDFEIPFVTPYKFMMRLKGDKADNYRIPGTVIVCGQWQKPSASNKEKLQMFVCGADTFRMGVVVGIPRIIWQDDTIIDPSRGETVTLPDSLILQYGMYGGTIPNTVGIASQQIEASKVSAMGGSTKFPGDTFTYPGVLVVPTKNFNDAALVAMGFMKKAGLIREYRKDTVIMIKRGSTKYKLPVDPLGRWPVVYPEVMNLQYSAKAVSGNVQFDYNVWKKTWGWDLSNDQIATDKTISEKGIVSDTEWRVVSQLTLTDTEAMLELYLKSNPGEVKSGLVFRASNATAEMWFKTPNVKEIEGVTYGLFANASDLPDGGNGILFENNDNVDSESIRNKPVAL